MASSGKGESLSRAELEAYWMPSIGNRQFKQDPRMIVAAQGCYLIDDKGRRNYAMLIAYR